MASYSDNPTYYDVLHVARGAPEEIIRASYRTLMQRMRHHPDLGGDSATAALINEAYAVLTDADRRAAYDLQLDIAGARIEPGPTGASEPADADPLLGCRFCSTPHEFGLQVAEDDVCAICFSPLYVVDQQDIDATGKRAVRRIRKKQDIQFFTHWPQSRGFQGRTEDVSPSGLRFTTGQDLAVGQIIKIVSGSMAAVARVTHCSQKSSGWRRKNVAGVKFLTLRFESQVGGFVSRRV